MNKIIKILSVSLIALSLGISVDASIKENETDYTGDTYIIGYSRFSGGKSITVSLSSEAGQYYQWINTLLGKGFTKIKIYYRDNDFKEWYDMSNPETPLTNTEVEELNNNLYVYFVDGQEKIIEIEYSGTVDINSLPEGVTYENGKFKVPATTTTFNFKDEDGNTVEASTNNSENELAAIVKTSEGFKCALKNNFKTIKLDNDIEFDNTVTINKDITIDLNNHNISTSTASPLFLAEKGNFTITGNGNVTSTKEDVIIIKGSLNKDDENYTVVTIDKSVTIRGQDYAMFIAKNGTVNSYHAYGVVVNIYGTLESTSNKYGAFYINGYIQDKNGNFPKVNIKDATFKATGSTNGSGIYAAGYAEWNINNATITGTGLGLGIKAGKFNIENSTISATGNYVEPTIYNDGINETGSAIQVETNSKYADSIELTIKDTKVNSTNSYGILEYGGQSQVKSMSIEGSKTEFVTEKDAIKTSSNFSLKPLKGGIYDDFDGVENYVADGYIIMHDENTSRISITKKKTL